MNRHLSNFSLLGALLLTSVATAAEPIVVKVWPGKPPGDVGIEGEEFINYVDSEIPGVGRQKLIEKVSTPTLTVYPADPDKNTGTAIIICPGGGYHRLYWELEGEEVAAWLNSVGMTGIILKYRCPRREGDTKGVPPLGPLLDAQRAVSIVRSHAKEWGINPDRIGLVGFSAGGHLAVATGTECDKRHYDPIDDTDKVSCRPNFGIGCYSGYFKDASKNEDKLWEGMSICKESPPILLLHANDDGPKVGGSDAENSAIMYLFLKRAGIPVELHIFGSGNHDFGVRQRENFLPSAWPQLAINWLSSLELYTPRSVDNPVRKSWKAQ